MLKTARPVVWEGLQAQSCYFDPITSPRKTPMVADRVW
jgi:hypothetical protein